MNDPPPFDAGCSAEYISMAPNIHLVHDENRESPLASIELCETRTSGNGARCLSRGHETAWHIVLAINSNRFGIDSNSIRDIQRIEFITNYSMTRPWKFNGSSMDRRWK